MKPPVIEQLYVDLIETPSRHRAVDPKAVEILASSVGKIGLKTPITVYCPTDDKAVLVAGAHRLAAVKQLGWEKIDCFIMDGSEIEAEMWEISENLHRAELTVLQRAEQIGHWVGLSNKLVQLEPVSKGGRGKEGGERKASRDLNIDRAQVHRAVKVSQLTPEAKQAAVERGLDDNQSALIAAAAVAPEQQATAIHNYADTKARAAEQRANVPKQKDWTEVQAEQKRRLMSAWNAADPEVKQWFRDEMDAPIMDRRFT